MNRTNYLLFFIVVTGGVLLDQVTKFVVSQKMPLYSSIPVIDNLFSITYVRNPGAAFGMFSNSDWRIPFLVGVSLVALVAIAVTMHKTGSGGKITVVALSLIFAGAAGNLIDRIRFGEVVDFLDVYWTHYHWPAFNVADSAICLGVFLYAVSGICDERRYKKPLCKSISLAPFAGGENER